MGIKWPQPEADHSPHLQPTLRMNVVIFLHPCMSLWCGQGQCHLYLIARIKKLDVIFGAIWYMPETAAGFHSCALFSPIKLPKYTHVLSLTDENSFDLDSIGSTSPAYLAEKIYVF
jgi:hypothetical protein